MQIRIEFCCMAIINVIPIIYIAKQKVSVLTFFSTSTSSDLAFFSYPGGGNGKQRDIAQNPKIQSTNSFNKRKCLDYFPVALFQKGNGPVTMHLSMHHVPAFISCINTPSYASWSFPTANSKAHQAFSISHQNAHWGKTEFSKNTFNIKADNSIHSIKPTVKLRYTAIVQQKPNRKNIFRKVPFMEKNFAQTMLTRMVSWEMKMVRYNLTVCVAL